MFVAIALMACEEDYAKDARSPIYGELTLTPNVAHPGDSITGVVSYQDKGKSIYKIDYSYTVSGNFEETGTDTTYSYTWSVVDPTRYGNPTFKFKAPHAAGNFRVTFKALHIHYATGGPNGELYGSANTVSQTFTVE